MGRLAIDWQESEAEWRRLWKQEQHPERRLRLRTLYYLRQGQAIKTVSQKLGIAVCLQTKLDTIFRYRLESFWVQNLHFSPYLKVSNRLWRRTADGTGWCVLDIVCKSACRRGRWADSRANVSVVDVPSATDCPIRKWVPPCTFERHMLGWIHL